MVIDEWLEGKALNRVGFDYDNGAGLSRHSRLTAEQIVGILLDVYKGPFMPEFMASLSLSGLDGTMLERFSNEELTGKLHVKTGMINHVSSMAGYLCIQKMENDILSQLFKIIMMYIGAMARKCRRL